MSRRPAVSPSLMSAIAAGVRGALARGRPQASTHVRTLTTSQELAAAMSSGAITDSGMNVSPDSAMRVASVYACVRIIANAIAMCPLILYHREGEKETEALGHQVHHLLKFRPNRFQTPYEWKQLLATHLLMRGNAYWFIGRVGGRPDELFPMHPDRTQLYRWTELEWQYHYSPWNGGFQVFDPPEVLHTRGISTDGIEGLSVIEYARQAIGLAAASEKHGAKLFGSGAQIPAVMEMGPGQKLSPERLKQLQDEFSQKYAGLDNAYKVPILEEGMKLTKVGMTAEESQFIESRKFSRSEIAMFFGVPPHMLGDVDKQTSWGSGIEQQSIGFVKNVVQPWLINIQDSLDVALLAPAERPFYFTRFNTEGLIQGDFKSMVDGLVALKNAGFISANEGRRKLGYNPRPDEYGDDYTVPANMASQTSGPPVADRGRLVSQDQQQKALPAPQKGGR